MHLSNDNMPDAALVARVLAGEREAFSMLAERYYISVLKLCARLLGSVPEAQDIAQEAVLQAFLHIGRLHEPARFGAWLHAIAANLARMSLRRRRPLSLDALTDNTWQVMPSAMPTPEDVHEARVVHDAIIAALNELSLVNREVVVRFYLEGYSYAELAELLGVPVSTVKGRLFKGRSQLRQTLAPIAQDVLKPDRRKRKIMEASEFVEATLADVRESPVNDEARIVVLRVQNDELIMPIFIGQFEGAAIAMAMQQVQMPRPMTHDLALRMVETLGARIERVVINKLAENTFYAEIVLTQGKQTATLDARPSDALALAARTSAPVFVARAVLDEAGGPDDEAFWEKIEQRARELSAQFAQSQSSEEPA